MLFFGLVVADPVVWYLVLESEVSELTPRELTLGALTPQGSLNAVGGYRSPWEEVAARLARESRDVGCLVARTQHGQPEKATRRRHASIDGAKSGPSAFSITSPS